MGFLDFGIFGFGIVDFWIFGFLDFGVQTPSRLENAEKPLIFVNAKKTRKVRTIKMP